jgi:F-type H+-transporting ATPase subunit delta
MALVDPLKFAQALADVAGELKQEDQVLKELTSFSALLDSNKELMEALTHPAVPFSAKRNIVQELAKEIPLSQIVVNFILVLIERARLPQFQEVLEAYGGILDELHGIVRADVFASEKVDKAADQRLQKAVSTLTGKKVKVNYHVDESLIGGLKLQIGSTIYDGSLGTQLEEVRRRLVSK